MLARCSTGTGPVLARCWPSAGIVLAGSRMWGDWCLAKFTTWM